MTYTLDNSDRLINIPIKFIKPNPYKVRKFFDITSVSDLADSIKKIGLLQPLLVRKFGESSYELVSGERRLKAAEIAGLETIDVIVMNISDDDSAVFALAENFQRKGINFFECSSAYYHLIFDHNISRENLSKMLGVSEKHISYMLSLYKLSSAVKSIIVENGLSEEYAKVLLELESNEERLFVLKKAIENHMTCREMSDYINKRNTRKPAISRKAKNTGSIDYSIVFNTINKAIKLVSDFGVSTKARKREKNNCYEYIIRISK